MVALGTAAAVLGGCDRDKPAAPVPAPVVKPAAAPARPAAAPAAVQEAGVTPMAERVAVLGFLNKRNGIERDLSLKPGQSVRVRDDVIVRLRACETTPPWQFDRWTGAFVQVDVRQPEGGWKRVFSGWLYKESPSLNVVEHPVYDVWPKSCVMTFPDAATSAESVKDVSAASSNDQSAVGPRSGAKASDKARR
jgi:hypothetical protein